MHLKMKENAVNPLFKTEYFILISVIWFFVAELW